MPSTPLYLSFILPILLASCASIPASSTCPKNTSGECQSMGAVNDLVDQGAFDESVVAKKAKRSIKKNSLSAVNTKARTYKPATAPINNMDVPERTPETVLKIWFAAYEDGAGNYVSEHAVFTVVQPSYWHNKPASITRIAEEALLTPSLVRNHA